MKVEGMIWTESMSAWALGSNSNKNSQFKILKPYAHLCIIGRKPTKFQMNPMKDVGRVVETRSWLAKFMLAWAITQSKIVESTCTSSYHRQKANKISSESNERCRS